MSLDRDAGVAQLLDDRVEVADAEVDLPALVGGAERVRVARERREDRLAAILEPARVLVAARLEHDDAEVLAVPAIERVRVARAEEEPADAGHPRHRRPPDRPPIAAILAAAFDGARRDILGSLGSGVRVRERLGHDPRPDGVLRRVRSWVPPQRSRCCGAGAGRWSANSTRARRRLTPMRGGPRRAKGRRSASVQVERRVDGGGERALLGGEQVADPRAEHAGRHGDDIVAAHDAKEYDPRGNGGTAMTSTARSTGLRQAPAEAFRQ